MNFLIIMKFFVITNLEIIKFNALKSVVYNYDFYVINVQFILLNSHFHDDDDLIDNEVRTTNYVD